LELSDQVAVMSAGRIEQVDTPQKLYAQPSSRFVFDFLGQVNVFRGERSDSTLAQGDAWVRLPDAAGATSLQLYMRSHEVRLQTMPNFRCASYRSVWSAQRFGWSCPRLAVPVKIHGR